VEQLTYVIREHAAGRMSVEQLAATADLIERNVR
jgi:hypothetical protein